MEALIQWVERAGAVAAAVAASLLVILGAVSFLRQLRRPDGAGSPDTPALEILERSFGEAGRELVDQTSYTAASRFCRVLDRLGEYDRARPDAAEAVLTDRRHVVALLWSRGTLSVRLVFRDGQMYGEVGLTGEGCLGPAPGDEDGVAECMHWVLVRLLQES